MRRSKELGDSFSNELRFWLENLAGHGRIIAERTVGFGEVAEQAEEFSYVFTQFLQRLEKNKGIRKVEGFQAELTEATHDFIAYQDMVLNEKLSGRLGETIRAASLEHMYMEGECWQHILHSLTGGRQRRVVGVREAVAYFRAAAEHVVLIRQTLEPSERRLSQLFAEYEREWLTLLEECRALAVMTARQHIGIEAIRLFVSEIRPELNELVKTCQMLCEIKGVGRPVALLSLHELTHIKNESEHFQFILSLLHRYGAAAHEDMAGENDAELTALDDAPHLDEAAAMLQSEAQPAFELPEGVLNERAGHDEPVITMLTLPDDLDVKPAAEGGEAPMPEMTVLPTAKEKGAAASVPVKETAGQTLSRPRLALPRQMAGASPAVQLEKKLETRIRPLGSKDSLRT